LGLSYLNKGNK
jgi:hypothetical protein